MISEWIGASLISDSARAHDEDCHRDPWAEPGQRGPHERSSRLVVGEYVPRGGQRLADDGEHDDDDQERHCAVEAGVDEPRHPGERHQPHHQRLEHPSTNAVAHVTGNERNLPASAAANAGTTKSE